MMLTSLNSNLALYFIESLLGTIAVGHFAAILYLITAARTVINALSQTASPRLAQLLHARNRSGFNRLQRTLIALGLSIGITGAAGAWLLGKPILSLVYSPEYAQYSNLLVWLVAANSFTFANAFLAAGLTAMRSFRPMLAINVFSIFLTTVLLAILIPRFGLIGAAGAVGGSAALKFALNYRLSRRSEIWSTPA
jgi:O-antigen/teichoic acid export membrane protein